MRRIKQISLAVLFLLMGIQCQAQKQRENTIPCEDGVYKEAVYPHGDETLIELFKKAFDFDTKNYTGDSGRLMLLIKFDITNKGVINNVEVKKYSNAANNYVALENKKEKQLASLLIDLMKKIGTVSPAQCNDKDIESNAIDILVYINDENPLYDHVFISTSLFVSPKSLYQGMNLREPDTKATYKGGDNVFLDDFIRIYRRPNVAGDTDYIHVIVRFTVEKDGSLTDIKVIKEEAKDTGEEAVRVLEQLGNWIPAMYKGQPVRYDVTLPIMFHLKRE